MYKYLSQEWLDEYCRLAQESQPKRPGTTVRVQYNVTGGPDGDVPYYWIIEDGIFLDAKLGTLSDADFTLTMSYEDSASVQRGDLDPMGAFMQGKMSVSGQRLKMMKLMPLTNAPEWKALQEDIREMTAY